MSYRCRSKITKTKKPPKGGFFMDDAIPKVIDVAARRQVSETPGTYKSYVTGASSAANKTAASRTKGI